MNAEPSPLKRFATVMLFAGVLGVAFGVISGAIDVSSIVQAGAAGALMIGLLVVIHEFGHFLAARLFGVGTPVFSIGVGPRLWGIRLFDTDFRLSWLPIGGYVQMSGADPFGEEDPDAWVEPEKDFMRKPVWQRLLIMLAGPAMNLMLPYALFTAGAMLGEPASDAVIGRVSAGSAAEAAGLAPQDRVIAVDGQPVSVWVDLRRTLARDPGGAHSLTVVRGGERHEVALPAGTVSERYDGEFEMGFDWSQLSSRIGVPDPASPAAAAGLRTGDAVLSIDGADITTWRELAGGLSAAGPHDLVVARADAEGKIERFDLELPADPGFVSTLVPGTNGWGIESIEIYAGRITRNSAADRVGVVPGDRITAIDGTEIQSWDEVIYLVARTASPRPAGSDEPPEVRELELELIRDGQRITKRFAPTWHRELVPSGAIYRPIMGIAQYPDAMVEGAAVRKYYAFGEALAEAHHRVKGSISTMFGMLWDIATQEVGITEAVGGPVAIFRIAGESAANGVFTFVRVMGMISLSLGVVNLLPIPVLDGGQIVFYAFEGLRGRPLPLAWRERIQMVGVLLLAALFVVVTVSDVSKLVEWLTG